MLNTETNAQVLNQFPLSSPYSTHLLSSQPLLCPLLISLSQLQQVVEEKGGVSAQLRAVSQTLRDTQNRCYWLENQALPNQHHQGLAKVESRVCVCVSQACLVSE